MNKSLEQILNIGKKAITTGLIAGTMSLGLANCGDTQNPNPTCENSFENYNTQTKMCQREQPTTINVTIEDDIKTFASGNRGYQRFDVDGTSVYGSVVETYPNQKEITKINLESLTTRQKQYFVNQVENNVYDISVGNTKKNIEGKIIYNNSDNEVYFKLKYALGQSDPLTITTEFDNLYHIGSEVPNEIYDLKLNTNQIFTDTVRDNLRNKYNIEVNATIEVLLGTLNKDSICRDPGYRLNPKVVGGTRCGV